jgi:signal transduction histidine kinase
MTEGRRSLLRSLVPVVGVTLALGVIAVLALDIAHTRHTQGEARMMAETVVPSQHALQEIDRAIADLAVVAMTPHTTAELAGARDRLEWALHLYHPDPAERSNWADVRARIGGFEEDATVGARDILPLRMDGAFAALRTHSALDASQALTVLNDLAATERTAMLTEVCLLVLVAGACIVLLLRAARREEHEQSADEAVMRRLERTNADLEAFAGRIAHDLRGPLSPILAGSQLIESAPVSSEVRRVAERIERSARKLFSMIDALLSFTRMSGERDGDSRTSLPAVIDDVLAAFGERAAQLGAHIDVRVETHAEVRCEAEIAASMLQNLLENALKYGLDGSPDRVVEVRAFDVGTCTVVEVEDHGPGVPARLVDRVFEPLVQGDGGRGGVGLGLATVRRLVEARGGSVELRPGRRGGALFRVTLPRVEEAELHAHQ